jgi:glycosyltransferase involved in cell wall biosynthesis
MIAANESELAKKLRANNHIPTMNQPRKSSQLPRLLVVLNNRFWADQKGSSLRISLLLEELSATHQIDLFFLKRQKAQDKSLLRSRSPFIKHVFFPKSELFSPLAFLHALACRCFHKLDPSLHPQAQPTTIKDWRLTLSLVSKLRKNNYHAVLFEYIWTAKFVNRLSKPHMPQNMWIDTHDVMHQRHRTSMDMGIHVRKPLSAEDEAGFLRPFSRIIAIQPEEAEEFRRLAPGKEVITIMVSPRVGAASYPRPAGFDAGLAHIIHVSASDRIAVQSLRWFLETAWPAVLASHPQCCLHVIGSIGSAFANEAFPAVRFLGYIDDLTPYYQHADLAINPCLAGSGLKIKTVEALAHGRPLITTHFGAQGINAVEYPMLYIGEPDEMHALFDDVLKRLSLS